MTASIRAGRAEAAGYYDGVAEALASARERGRQTANARDDYYTASPGAWFSLLGKLVRDGAPVEKGQIATLARGYSLGDPPKALVQNADDPGRQGYFDLTTSVPKSVSVLWANGDVSTRRSVEQAILTANREMLAYGAASGLFTTRRGKGGAIVEPVADVAVASLLQHTSRAGDPQLHVHNPIMNVAMRSDGTHGTLNSARLFARKTELGAVFRSALARELRGGLGVAIEADGRSFCIAGISAEVQAEFSRQRAKISNELDAERAEREALMDDAVAELGTANDPGAARKAADRANRRVKARKVDIPGDAVLEADWRRRFAKYGLGTPNAALDRARQAALAAATSSSTPTPPIGDLALAEALRTDSAVNARTVRRLIAEHSQTAREGGGAATVEAEYRRLVESGTLKFIGMKEPSDAMFTTRARVELERDILAYSEGRKGEGVGVRPDVVEAAIARRPTIYDEQARALRHVARGDGVVLVEGVAGAGKTFMTGALVEAATQQHLPIIGLAPSWDAAGVLARDAQIETRAIQGFVMELEKGKRIAPGSLIIVDEAGMVGSKDAVVLLRHAAAARAQVVMLGDRDQLEAVDAGSPFSTLSDRLGAARMGTVTRQNDPGQRAAAQTMADGQVSRGLAHYEATDRLSFAGNLTEAVADIAQRVVEDARTRPDGTRLVLSPTRATVQALNEAIRDEARKAGLLSGPDIIVDTVQRLPGGEKKQAQLVLAQGDRIALGSTVIVHGRRLPTNSRYTIISLIDDDDDPRGPQVTLRPDRAEEPPLTVRLGQLSKDENSLPAIDPAWAVTVHASQGQSVDKAWLVVDGYINGRLGYVGATRHKGDLAIVVNTEPIIEGIRERGMKPDREAVRDAFYKSADARTAKNDVANYIGDLDAWLAADDARAKDAAEGSSTPPAARAAAGRQALAIAIDPERAAAAEASKHLDARDAPSVHWLRDRMLMRAQGDFVAEREVIHEAETTRQACPEPPRPTWTRRIRAGLASLAERLQRPDFTEALIASRYERDLATEQKRHQNKINREKAYLRAAIRAATDFAIAARTDNATAPISARAIFAAVGLVTYEIPEAAAVRGAGPTGRRVGRWAKRKPDGGSRDIIPDTWVDARMVARDELPRRLDDLERTPPPFVPSQTYAQFRASFLSMPNRRWMRIPGLRALFLNPGNTESRDYDRAADTPRSLGQATDERRRDGTRREGLSNPLADRAGNGGAEQPGRSERSGRSGPVAAGWSDDGRSDQAAPGTARGAGRAEPGDAGRSPGPLAAGGAAHARPGSPIGLSSSGEAGSDRAGAETAAPHIVAAARLRAALERAAVPLDAVASRGSISDETLRSEARSTLRDPSNKTKKQSTSRGQER